MALRLLSNSLFNRKVVFLDQWRLVKLKDKGENENKKNSTES